MNSLEKLKQILEGSKLSSRDQKALVDLFSSAKDEELEPVIKLFSENPEWIEKISHNHKIKQEALKKSDANLWQKIIQEEESQLRELEK
jgi:hypothetical protein|tara:strand:+ start:2631 stop:2897 length:267 start_codon:yes stop_codon:yes gene_type:complete